MLSDLDDFVWHVLEVDRGPDFREVGRPSAGRINLILRFCSGALGRGRRPRTADELNVVVRLLLNFEEGLVVLLQLVLVLVRVEMALDAVCLRGCGVGEVRRCWRAAFDGQGLRVGFSSSADLVNLVLQVRLPGLVRFC